MFDIEGISGDPSLILGLDPIFQFFFLFFPLVLGIAGSIVMFVDSVVDLFQPDPS